MLLRHSRESLKKSTSLTFALCSLHASSPYLHQSSQLYGPSSALAIHYTTLSCHISKQQEEQSSGTAQHISPTVTHWSSQSWVSQVHFLEAFLLKYHALVVRVLFRHQLSLQEFSCMRAQLHSQAMPYLAGTVHSTSSATLCMLCCTLSLLKFSPRRTVGLEMQSLQLLIASLV